MSALTVTLGADITSMKRSLGGAMGYLSSFAKRISGVFSLKGAITGALAGGGAAALATKLNAAGEAGNTANARIRSVATSMGLFGEEAGAVAQRLTELAEKTELQTGVDRNAIKLTQAKLLTFRELAKTAAAVGGNFDRATSAAVDLAAAGFGSAEQNATQLGKALNNPIKGITALARAGVTFTEQEKDKIRQLVETNRMLETEGLRQGFAGIIADIRQSIPKPKERDIKAGLVPPDEDADAPAETTVQRMAPIVTSLGKVGGGGYSTGALDAQRENNRLTGETNRLLVDLNRRVEKLGGTGQAAFG